MAAETPTFTASSYASTSTPVGALGLNNLTSAAEQLRDFQQNFEIRPQPVIPATTNPKDIIMATVAKRRMVQVFIADTNDNLPLENCLLYSGTPQLTDLTDQELYFEIDIKTLLKEHNEKRTKIVNKLVKDRTEYLEAAKIRDLTMTVVTIASF